MRPAGLIPEVHPKCIEQREQAVLLRNRARLVRERTRMVNRIHAQLHNVGLHLERGRLLTQNGRQWVRDVAWPLLGDERRLFIDMQWALIDQIVPMIRKMITQVLSYSPVDRATFSPPRTGKGGLRPIDFLRLIDARPNAVTGRLAR